MPGRADKLRGADNRRQQVAFRRLSALREPELVFSVNKHAHNVSGSIFPHRRPEVRACDAVDLQPHRPTSPQRLVGKQVSGDNPVQQNNQGHYRFRQVPKFSEKPFSKPEVFQCRKRAHGH